MEAIRRRSLGPGIVALSAEEDQSPLSLRRVFERWQEEEASRRVFLDALARAPFPAYFLEFPMLRLDRLDGAFECVLIDAPRLAARHFDPRPFAEHFAAAPEGAQVTAFDSLGKDARLIVPLPTGDDASCVHLARFVREAPAEARDALWLQVTRELIPRLGERPLWLSTNGLGVSWLHVRIDERPKYFQHAPYCSTAPPHAPGG